MRPAIETVRRIFIYHPESGSHVVNNWRNEMEFTKAELEVIHNALISYTKSRRGKLDVCVREQWHELAEHTLQQIDRAVTLRDRIATGGF